MNIARSSIKLFLANAGGTAISFLGITYFAHELGAAVLGVFFLFEAILGILSIPADFGIRGAVEKRISEGRSPAEVLSTAVMLKLLPLAIIVIAILLLRGIIDRYLGANIAIFLVFAIILQEFAQLMVFVMQGELRVEETALLRLSRHVVWVGVGGVLTLLGYGILGLVYGLIAGLAVMLVWGLFRRDTEFGQPSLDHARSLFDYSKYAFISSVGAYFYQWMDIAIIGIFLTQTHVGAYEVAWRVTLIVMLFSRAIATTVFPQISEWSAAGTTEAIEDLIPDAVSASLFFVIPAFFGVAVFSREILGLVFGQDFTIAWLVLIILMGEKIFQAPHLILGKSLQGINRPDLAARSGVVAMVLNFTLNVLLVWQFGIVGAAIATTISFIVNSILHGYYLSRFITIRLPCREISWYIISSAFMSLLLLVIRRWIPINSVLVLGSVVAFGVLAYLLLALLSPRIRGRIRKTTSSLK